MSLGLQTLLRQRIAAVALAAALALTAFSSCLIIAEETNHECTGDGCAVCAVLGAAHAALGTAAAPAAGGGTPLTAACALALALGFAASSRPCRSLFALKTQLNI